MSNQRVKLFSASVCAILICGGMGGTAAYANETAGKPTPETAGKSATKTAGKSQLIKPGEVPQGLDKTAWNKIRNQIDSESIQSVTIENQKSQIKNSSMAFQANEKGGFSAQNSGKELKMHARKKGFDVSFRDMPGLILNAVALKDSTGTTSLQAVEPVHNGKKLNTGKGLVIEWYLNRAEGVEQGFTITAAADGAKRAPATTTIMLGFSDELTVKTSPAGDKAFFHIKETGRQAYNYEGLKAWDARGHVVPARLEASNQRSEVRDQKSEINILALVLDTSGATYPIYIDPIIYGSEIKLTASDGVASDEFGHSVSVNGDVAIVGAIWDDDQGSSSGSAYIFERNAGGTNAWGQVQN